MSGLLNNHLVNPKLGPSHVKVYSGSFYDDLLSDVPRSPQHFPPSPTRSQRMESASFIPTTSPGAAQHSSPSPISNTRSRSVPPSHVGSSHFNQTGKSIVGTRPVKQRSEAAQKKTEEYFLHQASKLKEQERKVRAQLERTKKERDKKFQEMFTNVVERNEHVDSVLSYLNDKDARDQQKREELYLEWERKVYGAIQAQIHDHVDSQSSRDLSRKRRGEFDKFLEETNKKGGLFRDIIIETDYDPLAAKQHEFKAVLSASADPLKKQLVSGSTELSILNMHSPQRDRVNLGRDTLDVTIWDRLDCTPYGRFPQSSDGNENILSMNTVPQQMVKPSRPDFAESKIVLDHYNVATGVEVVDKEFPKGKRTFPTKR
eukprot:GILJ01001364.1.p1 GENE.GILJ01001364.1~~GILJ01001364.1.p1  ORF type:complete len:373 (+),score=45.89 GILJ01001364.1:78-1196(+)